jgi:ribose transport system substrate-binding protein
MKKVLGITIMAVIVLSVVFCAGAISKASAAEAYKVGFIVGSREHVFYTLIEKGINDAAKELGINAVVLDGNLDGNVTSDHINNLVAESCKAIALSVNDPGGTTPAIEAADRDGVPVFTFDCTSTQTKVIKAFVGTDNVEGGRLGGRETVRIANAGAKVGLINYDEPQSCLDRRAGWEEIVKASDKNLQIVEIGNYTGDASKAEQLTTDALTQNPDIEVIFAVGDPAAAGALAAIKTAGASAKIIGFDGNPEAKAAILDAENGKFWVSEISQNPGAIGRQITEQIVKYLNTGKVDSEVIMISPYIITKENAAD